MIKINFKMKLEKQLTYLLILIIGFISGILFSSLEYNIFNIDKLIQKIKLKDSTSYEYKSNSEKLNHIFQTINKNYVDSINYVKFENELINTILTKLDPHSSYISVDNFKSIQEDMQGSFSGVGIEFKII